MGMLSKFIEEHRTTIIARCRARVDGRMAPRPTGAELEHGIPVFLDQLADVLASKLGTAVSLVETEATMHGGDLLRSGFSIAQVVHDYGDVCQSITELAIEHGAPITTREFKALNLCLDEAIAGAVSEFGRQRELLVSSNAVAQGDARATQDIGMIAHELRNLLGTATLATEVLRSGNVGIAGSTGNALVRSLASMRDLIDRSFLVVRLKTGRASSVPIEMGSLIEEIEVAAMLQARVYGQRLTVDTRHPDAVVYADRQILASIVINLLQNAFKYSGPHSHVTLRTFAHKARIVIEVEDECGGLAPGVASKLFEPYVQHNSDRSGLGLGLSICRRGADAIGATLQFRDLPGKGCVFSVELPLAPPAASAVDPHDRAAPEA